MNEPSLRARKKHQTRAALFEAAASLFAAQGFDQTSVDEITAAAGTSRRTFFRYFPGKESVAFPWHEERLRVFAEVTTRRAPGESPFAAIRRGCIALATSMAAQREDVVAHHRVVLGSPALIAADRALDLEWEAAIAAALRHGRSTSSAEGERRLRIMAGAIMGVVRTTVRQWFEADGAPDLVSMGLEGFVLLERGLGDASVEQP